MVGGGYTGLWTALLARERYPGRSVVLLEAGRCGWEAQRPQRRLRLGQPDPRVRQRPRALARGARGARPARARRTSPRSARRSASYGIDCGWEETGELDRRHRGRTRSRSCAALAAEMAAAGHEVELLDAAQARAEVDSPTYLGGLLRAARHRAGRAGPAGLGAAAGLPGRRRAHPRGDPGDRRSPRTARRCGCTTGGGRVRAGRVALATNAFPPLLRRLRLATVPVYDHVLMTEPLSPAQLPRSAGRGGRGSATPRNQFHYYRLTRDDRILWGGYDAIYHYGSRIAPDLEQRDATHERLAEHFFTTFPQLAGLGFSHRLGRRDRHLHPVLARSTARRTPGGVAYALGYTGLGVAASRFGAQVMLDLLDGRGHRADPAADGARASRCRSRRSRCGGPACELTRWSMGRADERGGRRNAWLRALDRVGLGFDS